jgi:capsular polysaccharide biosynthesis protein
VEIDEVAARLVRQYWALLVVCMLAPLVLITLIVAKQPAMYAANARIITSSEVPVTASQADAIVSQVQAIATGPSSASRALANAGVRANLANFVARHVSVAGLGTSQVVDITVTDPSPQVAQKAARIIASEVVASLNKVGQSGLSEALTAIDSEIVRLTEQRATLASQLNVNPHDQTLQAKLAGLDQVIANFTGDRGRLLIQASTQGLATIIDQPGLPLAPESKALPQKLGLAALLGLVLGILLAAIAETTRPTVPGARRVSRRLNSPMLGSLTESDLRGKRTPSFDNLVLQVRLAAAHAGMSNVALVDIDEERQLDGLARLLTSSMPAASPAPTRGSAAHASDDGTRQDGAASFSDIGATTVVVDRLPAVDKPMLRVYSLHQLQRQAGIGLTGIVVLSGPVARVSRIAALDDLSVAAGWPIIGVVGAPRLPRRSRGIRRVIRPKPGGTVAGVAGIFRRARVAELFRGARAK